MRYSYLFEQMVRRELRQRYKGSVLGVLWYLINPLVLMGVYGLMFGLLIKAPGTVQHNYLLYLFIGMIVWLFFSQSLLGAAGSLLQQSALVAKVRFPRETVPAAVVTVQLVTFVVLLALALPVSLALQGTAGPALLLLIPVISCLFCFALGLGLAAAILQAYFRDVQPILAAAMLPWFFITPTFFNVAHLSGVSKHPWARTVLEWVNPISPFIAAVRAILYSGTAPTAATLAYVVAIAAVALGAGLLLFRRLEDRLAAVL
jgi:ABC-type polysaccharide/polyol phosphate export permease